jgi:hypothetical protein
MNNFIKLLKNEYNKNQIIKNLKIINNAFNYKNSNFDLENLYIENSYINKPFKKLNNEIIISFTLNDKNIKINIYYNDKTKNIKIIIKNIIKRICCMLNLFNKNVSKNVNFNILLFYAPRIICKEYKLSEINKLSYFNCTCGWFRNITNNTSEIFVSRLNGCLGLLTHELCHLCKLDLGGYETFNEWTNYYNKFFNGISGYMTEGVNNAISTIIHALFLSCENKNKSFKEYYNEEYNYSYTLCQKLIKYFNVNTLKELIDKKIYTQNGQMFEYIILRYIYLKNIDKLFHINIDINTKDYYNLFINLLEYEKDKIINLKDNKQIEIMEYYYN